MAETDRISSLSNGELMAELKRFGDEPVPVTSGTRRMLENRLKQHLCGNEATDADSNQGMEPVTPVVGSDTPAASGAAIAHTPPPVTVTTDSSMSESTVFFGVQVPSDADCTEDNKVFKSRPELLKFVKKYPGCRFKMFCSETDAMHFSQFSLESATPKTPVPSKSKETNQPSEGSSFRGPKPQDLLRMRKMIETDKLAEVEALVKENPRYLIASGDTPTILQEGFRYNALHVIASKNKPEIGRMLLSTLENPALVQKMYPEDTPQIRADRIHFLLDLYLNTPDKGNGETALHFACKFGHVDVVDVLASHPLMDRTRINKYGETAKQVVCSRCKSPPNELREKIYCLLEDRVYIPLLRSEDNSRPAKIAPPWSPSKASGVRNLQSSSPKESPLKVKAYAGPMSPTEAKSFRKEWHTPCSPLAEEVRRYLQIRRGDSEKGLERIGREIAKKKSVEWKEYWDFLDCFIDLGTQAGLRKLEEYMQQKVTQVEKQDSLDKELNFLESKFSKLQLNSPQSPDGLSSSASLEAAKQLSASCNSKQEAALNTNHITGQYVFQQNAVVDNVARNLFQEFGQDDQFINNKLTGNEVNNAFKSDTLTSECKPSIIRESRLAETVGSLESTSVCDKIVTSNNKTVCVSTDSAACVDIATSSVTESARYINGAIPSSSTDDTATSSVTDSARYINDAIPSSSADEDSDDSFCTCASGVEDEDYHECSMYIDEPVWSPRTRAFVLGKEPTKTDVDVLRALDQVDVSPVGYPHVSQWKQLVLAYAEDTRKTWSSPARQARTPAKSRIMSALSPHSQISSPVSDISFASTASGMSDSDDSMLAIRTDLRQSFLVDCT